jgi:hypothetical protein
MKATGYWRQRIKKKSKEKNISVNKEKGKWAKWRSNKSLTALKLNVSHSSLYDRRDTG